GWDSHAVDRLNFRGNTGCQLVNLCYFHGRVDFQRAQILGEIRTKVVALQRKLDRRFQKSQLVSSIVALAFKGVAVNLLARTEQSPETVCELQLATGSEGSSLQSFKNRRRQNITPNDGQV